MYPNLSQSWRIPTQNSLQNAVLSAFKKLTNLLDDDLVSFPSFRFLFP